MNYVRKLGFEEAPDYGFLRDLFLKVLKNIGETDDRMFDWCLLNNGKGWEYGNVSPVSLSLLCGSPDKSATSSEPRRRRRMSPRYRPRHNESIVTASTAIAHRDSLRTARRLRQTRTVHRSSLRPLQLKSKTAIANGHGGPRTKVVNCR